MIAEDRRTGGDPEAADNDEVAGVQGRNCGGGRLGGRVGTGGDRHSFRIAVDVGIRIERVDAFVIQRAGCGRCRPCSRRSPAEGR